MYYILDKNNNVVAAKDVLEMGRWMEDNKQRVVKKTFLEKYDVEISTVFLGIDHNFSSFIGDCKPIVFETMIFWNDEHELDQYQTRYRTYKEARAGHRLAVSKVIHYIRTKLAKGEEVIVKQPKTMEMHIEAMLQSIDALEGLHLQPDTPMSRLKEGLSKAAHRYRESLEEQKASNEKKDR